MKIQQPSDNSLYVTIGDYVYYFDDSIEGENIVSRWHLDSQKDKDDRWHDLRKISDILRKTIQLLNKRVPKSFMLRSRDERRAKRELSTCQ